MYEWNFNDPYAEAWVLLRQAWEAMSDLLESEINEHQVTLAQIDILMYMSASKAYLTESQVASYSFRSPQSVCELVARMDKAGYLKRVRDTHDQRVVKIKMQPKGSRLVARVRDSGFVWGSRVIKRSLSAEEVDQLSQILRKVRDAALREIALGTEPLPDVLDRASLDSQHP
jgi:MarR family transcriptional regulator, organic hydroperoxide resistance regulator